MLTETARVKRTGHYDFDASSNKKMSGALADLNQQNNKTSYDINQVKNQVKDQVKEALIENKKKRRGGKKKKEKKNHESAHDQSNTKTSSFIDVQNHNTSLN